ncbi:MAG: MFS transporter [Planctomycetes bacterium]|nr:MFS transporter [Planctomycetota bacterium]
MTSIPENAKPFDPPPEPEGESPTLFRRLFASLYYRDYRLLWMGGTVSNIGSMMQALAVQHLVFSMTKSPVWLGFDAFATWIPMNLVLPFGGALADRLDHRRVLVIGNLLLGLIAAVLAVLYSLEQLHVVHLIIASALSGIIAGVVFPAFHSMVPQIIERRHLPNAVALNAVQFNLSRALGPAAGGLALILGATWCFGLNAASFAAVIITTAMLRWRTRHDHGHKHGVIDSVVHGLRYIASRRDIVLIEVTVTLMAIAVSPLLTMLSAYVDTYGLQEKAAASGLAWLMSSFGVGALAGASFNASRGHRVVSPWLALPLLVGLGLAEIALWVRPPFWPAVMLVALSGTLFMIAGNSLYAAVLASVPPKLQGRVSSIHFISFGIGLPVGSLLAGFIARGWDIQRVFLIYGASILVAACLIAWYVRSYKVKYHIDGHLDAADIAIATQQEGPA